MSTHRFLFFTTLLLLPFIFASATQLPNPPTSTSPRNHHHYTRNYHSCSSFSQKNSRSLCIQLQRIHQHQQQYRPLSPPSPPSLNEIDSRYGVEKRLVPSGPNPLHN
ncbi:hypothetical protein ACOSQ3_018137 [Xanthoceras sorbifolium]